MLIAIKLFLSLWFVYTILYILNSHLAHAEKEKESIYTSRINYWETFTFSQYSFIFFIRRLAITVFSIGIFLGILFLIWRW